MKKIITSLFIFVFSFMFINNVNAITITESTDPTDGLTTIQDNSIVIGVTRFEDGVVITAQRAATAGVNDALFNIGVDGYSGVNIYYYLGGSWFVLDDENQANPLDESNLEDKETIEELESPEIYYVNNVEKQLTVDFTFDGEGNLEFNTDNNKDGLVSYADGKLTIPATVKNLQIEIKDPATGDVLGLVVLTKDPVNNTDYETTSLTNYINALGRVVEADYTEASWTTYQSVVLANVVTKNNTQEEVDTATSNITTAQGSLVFAGKTALDAAKAVAGGLTESTYTIATWSVLTTALELPETTNALIVTKTTAITTAISNLVVKADLTAYNAALAAVVEADYTEASWATYQGVVSSNVVTVESTQGAVNTATANITTAQGSLITKLTQAKSDAKEELTTALGTYTGSDYTEGNWTILNGYKTTGDTAIENATTVGEVSTAKTTALEAMDGVLTNAEIEANAILYAQSNSTLTGDLIAGITATFPVIVPSYFEAGLYKINSEILLNGDVDGVITITKNGTPLVITGGLAAGTYTFTQLAKIASGLADEPIPANFVPSTYNGHVENYTVSVSSNLVPINTTISIRSIISKDNFVTNIELSKLENLSLILGYEDEGIVVSGQIVADGEGKVNGSLDFLGKDDLIIVGNVTGTGNITTFSGTVTGRINGNITAGLNANGIDTLSGVITDVSGATQPIRIIGTFIQSGIPGDFIGEIIVGPIPTYVESMTITSEGDINTLNVGNTLQLGVDIIPIGASNNVAWSVYVNDTGMGSISETGLFTATAEGTVTIIAKALDGSLKDDTFDITINPQQ